MGTTVQNEAGGLPLSLHSSCFFQETNNVLPVLQHFNCDEYKQPKYRQDRSTKYPWILTYCAYLTALAGPYKTHCWLCLQDIYLHRLPKTGFLYPRELDNRHCLFFDHNDCKYPQNYEQWPVNSWDDVRSLRIWNFAVLVIRIVVQVKVGKKITLVWEEILIQKGITHSGGRKHQKEAWSVKATQMSLLEPLPHVWWCSFRGMESWLSWCQRPEPAPRLRAHQ